MSKRNRVYVHTHYRRTIRKRNPIVVGIADAIPNVV